MNKERKLSRWQTISRMVGIGLVTLGSGSLAKEIYNYYNPQNKTLGIRTDHNEKEISFREAAHFARRLDGMIDCLPEKDWQINQETIGLWALEILPYYEQEGIVQSAIPPSDLTLAPYHLARKHFNLGGEANCFTGEVRLNARLTNIESPWSGSHDWLAIFVHELSHIQGICGSGPAVEPTIQIVTAEILAAMVNSGNKDAVYPLLYELRNWALGTAYLRALRANDLEAYERLREEIFKNNPLENAQWARAERFWANNPERSIRVLGTYQKVPLELIFQTIEQGKEEVFSTWLPPTTPEEMRASLGSPERLRPIILDDLIYFLEHAEEIVKQIREEGD